MGSVAVAMDAVEAISEACSVARSEDVEGCSEAAEAAEAAEAMASQALAWASLTMDLRTAAAAVSCAAATAAS